MSSSKDVYGDGTVKAESQLGLFGLIAVAIGATVASGVFSLPGDFAAAGVNSGAVLVGWIICGVGMFGLMWAFLALSYVRPDLKGGIYSFAQAGFGDYVGFNSAFGYWVSCFLCIVAFCNLFCTALNAFFPIFGAEGNTLPSILLSSAIVWGFCILCVKGVKNVAVLNILVTAAKMIPLFMFVLLTFMFSKFKLDIFLHNFWGDGSMSFMSQIKATSGITLWVFSGVEGAVVVSTRAKRMTDVGKATASAFIFILILYAAISLVSMGILPKEELAALNNPPMAYVLEYVVGPWGAAFINIGVMVSIIGATLALTFITAECANAAAKRGSFCKFFAQENEHGAPANSLILTTALIQIFLIITLFSETTYQALYTMSASMIMLPYFFSGLFYAKVVQKGQGFESFAPGNKIRFQYFVAIIAVIYGTWLVYAAGMVGLLVTSMLYAPGALIYFKGRKEQNKKMFDAWWDYAMFAVILVAGVASVVTIANGTIHPF